MHPNTIYIYLSFIHSPSMFCIHPQSSNYYITIVISPLKALNASQFIMRNKQNGHQMCSNLPQCPIPIKLFALIAGQTSWSISFHPHRWEMNNSQNPSILISTCSKVRRDKHPKQLFTASLYPILRQRWEFILLPSSCRTINMTSKLLIQISKFLDTEETALVRRLPFVPRPGLTSITDVNLHICFNFLTDNSGEHYESLPQWANAVDGGYHCIRHGD
jgi:hypothetical protein